MPLLETKKNGLLGRFWSIPECWMSYGEFSFIHICPVEPTVSKAWGLQHLTAD